MTNDSKRILVVDDEQKVGFFLSRSLTMMSDRYQVETAESGEQALTILKDESIDLMITDLRMPGISGLDLIRWIHSSSPGTRVVLITAYGNERIETQAKQLDVYRYLRKPFNLDDFTEVVQGALSEGASSVPGMLAFSEERFEAITARIEALRKDINAQCIYLADMQGQRLSALGNTESLDDTLLLTLLAGGFATSSELARQFGSGDSVNLNFHESSRYDIYSANVGDTLIIAIVYDRRVQKSRIGMVWLYTRRAIEDLNALTADAGIFDSDEALDEDFGDSLMDAFDSAFSGATRDDAESSETPEQLPPQASTRQAFDVQPSRNRSDPPTPGLKPAEEDEGENELFSLEEAINQGVIPPDLLNQ
jgi:DNA-binding response OmpR family regulator